MTSHQIYYWLDFARLHITVALFYTAVWLAHRLLIASAHLLPRDCPIRTYAIGRFSEGSKRVRSLPRREAVATILHRRHLSI